MPLVARTFVSMWRALGPVAIVLPVMLVICFSAQCQSTDTSSAQVNTAAGGYPDSITSFEQLEMPFEMATEFSRLQPAQALLFRDEFQQMHDGAYGEAERTIKVWYIDDHIIGYVIERPFDVLHGKIIKHKINIPVTWCCLPQSPNHPQHCTGSLAGLHNMQAENKCTGWFIKLPDAYNLNPKPVMRFDNKKGKNLQPKNGDFGHTQKTGIVPSKKKKGKQRGFEQDIDVPAVDSTGEKEPRDSI